MVGLYAGPRWRLTFTAVLFSVILSGCSGRREMADGSERVLPQFKLALIKIPLNGEPDDNIFDNLEPREMFSVDSGAIHDRPAW